MNDKLDAAARQDLRDQIEQPKSMSDEDKLLSGARLFDMACRATLDGILDENPDLNEQQAIDALAHRLRLAREFEQRQFRQKAGGS